MGLPAPDLDDRRFQDLVDEAKRLVQQRCPEWTDHNVSDPGVTLIETFAFMVDQLLYRLNRVPDRNYIKFLELIGIRLFAPVAAQAPVTFWLSAPRPDVVRVPAGTEVTTLRTEVDEAVVFTLDDELAILPCSLGWLRSQPTDGMWRDHADSLQGGPGMPCFTATPRPGDALYVGLSDAVPRCAVALRFDCRIEGVGVDPLDPPLRWESFDGTEWTECELQQDGTGGLNRAGDVVVHVPTTHRASVIDRQRAGWLRAVVAEARPSQPVYSSSPLINNLTAFTIGATAPASHANLIVGEILGVSDGAPGQRLSVKEAPVLAGADDAIVEVADGREWVEWTEVDGFADSGPEDRHFVLDRRIGEVTFGPAVRFGDGSFRQYGAVPPKGATVRMRAYRTGGGARGNVARGAICVQRSPTPFVSGVINRKAASGGVEGESLDEAKIRGPIEMRTRNRAVTAEDYEQLAREAAPEMARIRCVPVGSTDDPRITEGVHVLVVPAAAGDETGRLQYGQLKVSDEVLARIADHLDARRVIGARITVEPPAYQGVTVVARIHARPRARATDVETAALRHLYRYYDPIVGGPDGRGWPFGRPIHVGEVYAVLQAVDGVEYIEDARLYAADLDGHRGDPTARIELAANALAFSYEHLLRVDVT